MDTLQRATEVLSSAERALAAAARDAAETGDYDAAGYLIELARAVKGLGASARDRLPRGLDGATVRTAGVEAAAPSCGEPARIPRTRPRKGEYPKFLREEESLVKVGWSPSEKAEYEHKSHKRVLMALADAAAKAGARGKRFTMDRVLPLVNPADETRFPDYQVYLCLAWLRALGLLVQHGRKGYSLSSRVPMEPLIERHWMNLPSR